MKYLSLIPLVLLVGACSHDYNSDMLDLSFYQWNLWPDTEADWMTDTEVSSGNSVPDLPFNPPTCGWEVLHRGNGKMIRVPAKVNDYFPGQDDHGEGFTEDFARVYWFHVRFTLPEIWEGRDILLKFEDAGPRAEVYLNEKMVGFHEDNGSAFSIDVSGSIYYVRDNHLAVRISNPAGGKGGISGGISVQSVEPDDPPE